MKKVIALCLALALCLSLCACGASHDLTVRNETGKKALAIYISETTESTWGEKLNKYDVRDGSSMGVDFKDFDGEPGEYDVGLLDEDEYICEVYEVELNVGDTIVFAMDGDTPVLTVTDADGHATEYEGYYSEANLE